jgi:hypothetical protein
MEDNELRHDDCCMLLLLLLQNLFYNTPCIFFRRWIQTVTSELASLVASRGG